tara:strand:- start:18338 stop:18892 length:555 start_codon:yes stop_codon:yes gene_type:complete
MQKNVNTKLFSLIKHNFPILAYQKIIDSHIYIILPEDLLFVLCFFKNHISLQYKILTSISGVDIINSTYRFCVVYELLSVKYNKRVRLKIFIKDLEIIMSASKMFINANWWEREIWDLFGIFFMYNYDLRRILTDYGFEGYPMRKDFPLTGYVEVKYCDEKKLVVLEPVALAQQFRNFLLSTTW